MMKTDGLGRFFYEFAFHQMIEMHKERTGQPVMVSQARHLRDRLGYALAQPDITGGASYTMDDTIPPPVFMAALDSVLTEGIQGYVSPFGEHTATDPVYADLRVRMCDMTEMAHMDNGVAVGPVVGPMGSRLPISPYDPRFASRANVKVAGSALSYVTGEQLDALVDSNPALLEASRMPGLEFMRANDDGTRLRTNGPAVSFEDLSGLSELSSRMTRQEYTAIRDWVRLGAESQGTIDETKFMTPDATMRAAAILDSLRDEGVDYSIRAGRDPGSVVAEINNTRIQVNLMTTREREHQVGGVYDNGMRMYFMTTALADGRRVTYTPTAQDCVNLVRIARGKPVQRLDAPELVGAPGSYQSGNRSLNTTFRSDSYLSSVYADVPGMPEAKVVVQRNTKSRTSPPSFIGRPEVAEDMLKGSIDSARSRFMEELDPAGVVDQAITYLNTEDKNDFSPEFSIDPLVSSYQREYWDLITGRADHLVRPGVDRELYQSLIEGDRDMSLASAADRREYDELMQRLTYQGSVGEQLSQHTRDVADAVIGSYDLHPTRDLDGSMSEKRFDPSYVAKYMASSAGITGNTQSLVMAMRSADITADELMGDEYTVNSMGDRLVSFDASSAVSMEESESEFIRSMGEHIRTSLTINGVSVDSIQIDDAGVVQYSGHRDIRQTAGSKTVEFVGHLGQIWEPDELGAVRTKFAGSGNFLYVPGGEATVVPQKPGENKTLEERTVVRGYEQILRDEISYRISSDVLDGQNRSELGAPDSLNRVHRRLYAERHPIDFVERAEEHGLSNEWVEARLKTEARRVRYSNKFAEGSTIVAEYNARTRDDVDMSDDNNADAWVLTGGRNMSVLDPAGDAFFDPIATGTAKNQGIVRFMTESAQVGADGRLVPGEPGDRTPLMKLDDMKYMSFNPFDRQQMTVSNTMKAESVVNDVRTAQMVLRNWTLQDAIVTSKEFAESHMITGSDGQPRPLKIGDKLSDLDGNKGVIALIVDRSMDLDTARELDLEAEVSLFKANPELETVMSPFSAISRHNGGSARELMASPSDFVAPDGSVLPGHIGGSTLLVTHKAADKVTNIYGEEEVSAGKGRKASGQYGWILEDRDSKAIFDELYGGNAGSVVAMREYLNVVGLDIEPDGTLRVGREDHDENDARKVFTLPDEMPFMGKAEGARPLDKRAVAADFAQQISSSGGVLELPWPLTFPTGEELPHHTDSTYELPVMSVNLRTGQEFLDGRSVVHDYTQRYSRIYTEAAKYQYAVQRLEAGDDLSDELRERYTRDKDEAQSRAQAQFNVLTKEVINRQFEGKHNLLREKVMSHRVPNSATAILTPDPRLGLHQVGMNEAMMDAIGVGEGDRVLVHRDPMIHNGGLRYMEIVENNDVEGVVLNPAAAMSFEGDFDGDTLGIIALKTEAAKREAMERFSPEVNMLDFSVEPDEKGNQPLFFDTSCDVAVALNSNPEFVETLDDVVTELNTIERDALDGESFDELMDRRREMMDEANALYQKMADSQIATSMISYESPTAHMESVAKACIDTRAKGDEKKLLEYSEYVGFVPMTQTGVTEGGRPMYEYTDAGKTLHTREQDQGAQYATAVKAIGTAMAGTSSQMAVQEMRNVRLPDENPAVKAGLTLGKPTPLQASNNMLSKMSQAMLQAKKDPVDAYRRFQLVNGPMKHLLHGAKLEPMTTPDGVESFRPMRDDKNNIVKATRDEWVAQATMMCNDKRYLGVGVNPEMIECVADAMTKPDGTVRGFESHKGDDAQYSTASTMDRLAYKGTFKDWVESAQKHENIYAGSGNEKLAPIAVKKNIESMRQIESSLVKGEPIPEVKLTPIIARDVRPAKGEPRSAATLNGSGIAVLTPEMPGLVMPSIERLRERVEKVKSVDPGAARSTMRSTASAVRDYREVIEAQQLREASSPQADWDAPAPY